MLPTHVGTMLPTHVGTMLPTQVLILVHRRKVAVFYEKLATSKVLASYLVWKMLVSNTMIYVKGLLGQPMYMSKHDFQSFAATFATKQAMEEITNRVYTMPYDVELTPRLLAAPCTSTLQI